jgi:hypothetical protein
LHNGLPRTGSRLTGEEKTVSRPKDNILDDIAEGVRQILDDLDRLLNPEKQQRKPAPVPVPARIRPTRRPNHPDHR